MLLSLYKYLQVKVGQAVYLSGSLFNHSCQPNIHAYFVSRMLHIRSTEFVAWGSELELSYGPQVCIHKNASASTLVIILLKFWKLFWPKFELSISSLLYLSQVGELDCKDRQQLLKDRYSFSCECRGCSQLNLSDLVLNAYRCVEPKCFGVVLDSNSVKYEKQKLQRFHCFPTKESYNLNQVLHFLSQYSV